MYFTPYEKHDGYYESLCSLREGLGPILRCRAVRNHTGDYEAIVRDYETGKMVASKPGSMIYGIAKDMAKTLTFSFVRSEINKGYTF
jgi:hypothetical protein